MELFVDEAVSRILLPRVNRQVVEAEDGTLIFACKMRIKVEPTKMISTLLMIVMMWGKLF